MGRFRWALTPVACLVAGCAALRGGGAAEVPPSAGAVAAAPSPDTGPTVPVPATFRQAIEAGTRSETGGPGPNAWSNRVSYRIEADLDPATASVRGNERIVYRNDSPRSLPSVVLNLYQNVFSEGVPRNRYVPITGGVNLVSVAADGVTLARRPTNQIPVQGDVPSAPPGYSVQGTLARVRLPRPIAPGDSVVLVIDWEHSVPPAPSFRTGWEETLGSRVFHVAQWYPQVAMYDDLRGWDATPYLGDGEFYLPYGDFDVSITVPVGYLVGATGELANPHEVLTEEALARLAAAAGSVDTVTRIVTDADITAENTTQRSISGQLTWRFTAADVRDFAFAASAGYVWDATGLAVSDGAGGTRDALVHALYRPEAPGWSDAAAFGRHAMEVFDDLLVPYAYPQLTVAEGPINGMEYPMLVFIGKPSSSEALHAVIAHEAAHQWFPMMVGTDEASYAWIDEGLATYLENLAVDDLRDVGDPFAADRAGYLRVAGTEAEVPLMRHTDLVSPYGARVVAAYSKPAVLFRSLEWIVGPDTFRAALERFASEWLGAHPTPWDLFNTFETVSGRELDWFFQPWWFTTEILDLAITSVEGAGSGEAVVTIENRGGIAMPAIVTGTTASGASVTAVVGVEAWLERAPSVTVTLEAPGPIESVRLDPQAIFPDADRENDVWPAVAR